MLNVQKSQLELHDRCLTIEEVKQRTGLGKTKIYAMIKAGEFPRPGKFGTASRWSELAVAEVIARAFRPD